MKARVISPELFFHTYVTVMQEMNECIQSSYNDSKPYTQIIRGRALPRIAELVSLLVYSKDYYTLDAVFYDERDEKYLVRKGIYAKRILIAFEHENDIKDSAIEMNKLQLFNAPLKVLVCYTLSKIEQERWLQKYTEIIREADIFGDIATLRRQLVIFGEKGDTSPCWRGFQYEIDGFREIGMLCSA